MEERDNDIQPDAGVATKSRIPQLPPTLPVETTIDFTDSEELGRFLADVQLGKMIDAHTDRYKQGIDQFWAANSDISEDIRQIEGIADLQLEERRRCLVEVATRTVIYSAIGVFMALLTGMNASKAAWAIVPSALAAVYTTKEEFVRK